MHEEHPHPLLAQVPLSVSPFLSLPTGTTLPYTYKSLPSTLPPSLLDSVSANISDPSADSSQPPKPTYVYSAGGHAAHPDSIIANCRQLQAHLQSMQDDARRKVDEWKTGIRERELAEKRRVAPGWLDEEVKLLVPQKQSNAGPQQDLLSGDGEGADDAAVRAIGTVQSKEGEDLDKAFGGLGMR